MIHIKLDDNHIEAMDWAEDDQSIHFTFQVHSNDYHAVTTLLYRQRFLVTIPDQNRSFNGSIINYSTSITNLYEPDQVGTFSLTLQKEGDVHEA
ncbi:MULTISPECIES: DUF3219 family protein [unclassified Geomicrobium]|uniref:DUF3219 family protein n=1 Tax=unclassified Geomicrobium TaxID=2628951 RepID=UPI00045EDCF3|nr:MULTISPECIES: DUF3219 family protein [unclassified Geomicrobium]GAJ98324.1 hypothetical protein JCM19055_1243 [Geomicrobium sp. JCM 19055]GAK07646.1 hypothetical protein JCM19038_1388 [Geomicrobium sp. JCM 19038]